MSKATPHAVQCSARTLSRVMSFSFRFTSTHEDLLDAYAAQQRERSGMRPWMRACLAGLGFMWLAGAVASAPKAVREEQAVLPVIWLSLGSIIVWKFLLQPIFKRRHIRSTTPPAQPLVLEFTDSGLHVEAEGVGVFDRAWVEFVLIEPAEKGVAMTFTMTFTDGMVHWLPNRIFSAPNQRQALIDYVTSRLPKEDGEVSDVA
jgi:hypothetical protein